MFNIKKNQKQNENKPKNKKNPETIKTIMLTAVLIACLISSIFFFYLTNKESEEKEIAYFQWKMVEAKNFQVKIGNEEYLIEVQVDTEGINKYEVIDIETGEAVQKMEYDNFVRYPIPKDKLGKHKLESEDGKWYNKKASQ